MFIDHVLYTIYHLLPATYYARCITFHLPLVWSFGLRIASAYNEPSQPLITNIAPTYRLLYVYAYLYIYRVFVIRRLGVFSIAGKGSMMIPG